MYLRTVTPESKAFGQRIKLLRILRDMTQTELAKRTGFSNNDISRIENGRQNITAARLPDVAQALKVSVDDLLNTELDPATITQPTNIIKLPTMAKSQSTDKLTITSNILQLASSLFSSPDYTEQDRDQLLTTLNSIYQLLHPAISVEVIKETDTLTQ